MIAKPAILNLFEALQTAKPEPSIDIGLTTRAGYRFAAWRERVNSQYYPLDVFAEGEFEVAKAWFHDIASFRLGILQCDPMTVVNLPSHIRRHEDEFLVLSIPVSGKIWGTQRNREYEAGPGDISIGTTSDPYSFTQPTRHTRINMHFPAAMMRKSIVGIDDLTFRRFSIEQPMVRIFQDFLASVIRNSAAVSAAEAEILRRSLLDLLALALTAPAAFDSAESSVRLAHRQRILRFIEVHFGEYDLSSLTIAIGVGLSPRYIQEIFAARGETLTDVIHQRRLLEAQQLLRRRKFAGRSIEQIAYAVGFADPAYFSRVFRRRTGMTPGEYRKIHTSEMDAF